MNNKILIWTLSIILAISVAIIIYRMTDNREERLGLNENVENIVEISETSEDDTNSAVTDDCVDEWADYEEYVGEKVEEASSNLSEKDTHYLLKDVYGYIEVYYLDENNKEYLYKKTDIPTDYLAQEDAEDLKVGIEVVGLEAVNKMLEDFE